MIFTSSEMGRIVNGEIPAKAVPWQVSLQYRSKPRCGGVLIDQTTIITAAHCIKFLKNTLQFDLNPHNYKIVFGSKYRFPKKDDFILTVSQIIPYPEYINTGNNVENDIAILKVPWKHRITYNYQIRRICLPPHKNYLSIHDNLYLPPSDTKWMEDDCYISGYGAIKESKLP